MVRPFRLRINHVLDSFSLRIPKKTKTHRIRKLNISANDRSRAKFVFWELEGIASVELTIPDIESIYSLDQSQAVDQVKEHLKTGIHIACENDSLFAEYENLWEEMLSSTGQEFDHALGVSRSHRTRRWRCEAVLRIAPDAYRYDILVRDCADQEILRRHTIKTTECFLPYFTGIGFSKLRWDGQDIVGLGREDDEVFRFGSGLPA